MNKHENNKFSQKHALFIRNGTSNQINIIDNDSMHGYLLIKIIF